METPGKSSLHGFRTHPQDYVMVFFAPDTKALCQPVIEIPVLRHKTGRVAYPDHAHAIETIENWRQIPARDRKRVVSGKRVSVRVELGGRGVINKQKKTKQQT